MIKLKDLIEKFSTIYEVHLIDEKDGETLFHCKTDSKALEHYGDWNVKDISFIPNIMGISYGEIKIYISEV